MEERKVILFNQETEEDRVYSLSLRPAQLNEFVGQTELMANLQVSLQAAKGRKECLEHILFSGPPGLGKTTLANIVAHEMGARITITSGPAIERAGDLIGILTNLGEGDILFIDEIHRLSKVVEEFLYPAMESFKIDFIVDKGPYAKTINFNLKPFTLIGATTRLSLLSGPLRDRFGHVFHLNFYEPTDIEKIVKRNARILEIEMEKEAGQTIAERARRTPRVANRLLKRVRDFAEVRHDGKISNESALLALDMLKIDALGLDEVDRKLLLTMIEKFAGGPVGLNTLAAAAAEEMDTIETVYEPYLMQIGMLERTPRGRKATKNAYEHLKIKLW